jgi:two-component system chemotaxis response regulator CheB
VSAAGPVRVAICDDSRAYAVGLRRFLETERRLQVVAMAGSAEQLFDELKRVRPELITMDLELPGIDGIAAIRHVMATMPTPIVVISGQAADGEGPVSAALAAGAVGAVAKGDVRLDRRLSPRALALRRRLVRLARGGDTLPAGPPRARAPAPTAATPAPSPTSPPPGARSRASAPAPGARRLPRRGVASVVGIGASAGGPSALGEVLGALPVDFPLPVLVVQHISAGFAAGLAAWLDGVIALSVRLGRHGEPIGPGVVIAPDGAHLLMTDDGRLRLDGERVCGPHRPSVDVLLTSLAEVAGSGVVAVVLTGMGRDGAAGVAAVRQAGGVALVEHADRAHVSGMPEAAARAGATPLERAEIGRELAALAGSPRR